MPPPTREYKNLVLASLPKAEIDRLAQHLSPVTLKVRDELLDGKSKYAYFLEDGLASVVLPMENGATVEVGVVGREGVVGLPMLLGAKTMPGETYIQVAGSGFRIEAQRLKDEFERHPASCDVTCTSTCWPILFRVRRTPPAIGCIPLPNGWRAGYSPATTA